MDWAHDTDDTQQCPHLCYQEKAKNKWNNRLNVEKRKHTPCFSCQSLQSQSVFGISLSLNFRYKVYLGIILDIFGWNLGILANFFRVYWYTTTPLADPEIRFPKKKCVAASKWRENCGGKHVWTGWSVWLRKLRTGKNAKPNQIRNN